MTGQERQPGQSWAPACCAYLAAKSLQAGAPPATSLLPVAPLAGSPSWLAPSFAAGSLLPAAHASRTQQLAYSALWAIGATNLLYVAAQPYPHLAGRQHRAVQLLPLTVQYALADHKAHHKQQDPAAEARTEQHARKLYLGLAADIQPWGLRCLGYGLSYAFRWLYGSELYVDQNGLARLEALHAEGCSLVYVPTHKSHVDYLMLSYILFAAGLPCPHIAAGDNLALPLVGGWLRKCGAWFIRRTTRGAKDGALYKRVLAGYVRALLEEGHSLEFFIEGGRSRDGRVNAPKLGILSYVVDAVLDGGRPVAKGGVVCVPTTISYDLLCHTDTGSSLSCMQGGVVCVPITTSYDLVVEEQALARQLAGAGKRKESLGGLLRTVAALLRHALGAGAARGRLGLGAGGFHGRASVGFGQPIRVGDFLQERALMLSAEGGANTSPHEAPGQEPLEQGAQNGSRLAAHPPCYAAFPKGSEARRLAVAALGEEIAAQLRARSILPTSVLIAAAVEAVQSGLLCGHGTTAEAASATLAGPAQHAATAAATLGPCNGFAHSMATAEAAGQPLLPAKCSSSSSCCNGLQAAPCTASCTMPAGTNAASEHGVRGRAAGAGMALGDVEQAVEWVAGELQLRGAAVMRPGSAQGTGVHDMLVRAVGLLKGCLTLTRLPAQPSTAGTHAGSSTARSDAGSWVVQQQGGVEATLRWHMRLNQLLPWLAPEGLVTAGLLAEACQHTGEGDRSRAGRSSGWSDCGGAFVPVEAVLRRTQWLRQLLGPEIDTALSPESLRSEQSLRAVLLRLERWGAVAVVGPSSCEEEGALVKLASSGSSRAAALFAARLLAPHLATYAAAARAVHAQLSAKAGTAGPGLSNKALLQAVQAELLAEAATASKGGCGAAVVPSLLLAQGAITSLTALGLLRSPAPAPAKLPAAPDAAEAAAVPSLSSPDSAPLLAAEQLRAAAAGTTAAAAAAGGRAGQGQGGPPAPAASCGDEQVLGEGEAGLLCEPPLLDFSPQPSPLCTLAPCIPEDGLTSAAFQRRHGRDSAASSSSDSGGDDPSFDPVACSVAVGLCGIGGGGSSSGGGSTKSLPQLCGEEGASVSEAGAGQLALQPPSSGQVPAGGGASEDRPEGGEGAALAELGGQTGAAAATPAATVPSGSQAVGDTATLVLDPSFVGDEALQSLVHAIRECCVGV
ncbi:hypothetical protein N2152v2_008284 [Parachlorella kessleri]